MEIKHDNIVYIRDLSEIGGVETYTFEMIKKYKDLDIAVVYKTASPQQVARITKYCMAYQHIGQKIDCKVAIINYDTSIIDYITSKIWKENAKEDEGIYQVVHGDYENSAYKWRPPTDERIKQYIGVTKHICESFKKLTGLDNVIYSYNPLTIEKEKPFLRLISATRLSPIKGKNRMIKLINALDEKGIDYIWYIFTNSKDDFNKENVIFMKPRLDVYKWIEQSDYLIQLSDTEACSYSILEALYRNVPVIVTPLPYLEEIGVKNNENAFILNFDCSNIKYIVDNIFNKPKFNFKHLEDKYNTILAKGKSRYKEGTMVKVKATNWPMGVKDAETGKYPQNGDVWETNEVRAAYLVSKEVVEIIEPDDAEIKENASKEEQDATMQVTEKKPTKKKKKIDRKK